MNRPRRAEPSYEIKRTNASSYNILEQKLNNVPGSPFYRPGGAGNDTNRSYRGDDRDEAFRGGDRDDAYRGGDRDDAYRGGDRDDAYRGGDRDDGYRGGGPGNDNRGKWKRYDPPQKGYEDQAGNFSFRNQPNNSSYGMIKNDDDHLPRSPFYKPSHDSAPRDAPGSPNYGYGYGGDTRGGNYGGDNRGVGYGGDNRGVTFRNDDDDRSPNPATFRDEPRGGNETNAYESEPRYGDYNRGNNEGRRDTPQNYDFNDTNLYFDDLDISEDKGAFQQQQMPISSRREYTLKDYRGNPMPPGGSNGLFHVKENAYPPPNQGGNTDRSDSRARGPDNYDGFNDPRYGAESSGAGGTRNGGALLFLRFPADRFSVAKQDFLKAKMHDNGGKFLGIANRVYDFGYAKSAKEPLKKEAMGVFHFPSMSNAKMFQELDSGLKQPDWPGHYGHANMWIVCNAYLPDNMRIFNTFMISEIELHKGIDKTYFLNKFQKKLEQFFAANRVMPFVVCSYGSHDRCILRGEDYGQGSIVTGHLFQGLDHLRDLTSREEYRNLRSLHNQLADEKVSVFSLDAH